MSNTGHITTKKNLKDAQLLKDVKEIVLRRLGNKIPVKENYNIIVGFQYPWNVELWLENKNRIGFSAPYRKWSWWVRSIIENELAVKYSGWISDEGLEEKWHGEINKYPTFEDYIKECSKGREKYYLQEWKMEMKDAPKEIEQ